MRALVVLFATFTSSISVVTAKRRQVASQIIQAMRKGSASSAKAKVIKVNPAKPKADWIECMQNFLCRSYEVPLDYAEPDGEQIQVTIAARTSRGEVAKGMLWGLVGGPGGVAIPNMIMGQDLLQTKVPDFEDYVMDFRGTGQSTPLDCEVVREKNGVPSQERWLKWAGLGNLPVETLKECTDEIKDKHEEGYLRHFNSINAARDLAAIILSLKAEETSNESFNSVAILARSFGCYWASRFLELQNRGEFPVLVERVQLDGSFGPTTSYSRHALMSNEAGRNLMQNYCVGKCEEYTNKREGGWEWLKDTIRAIDSKVTKSTKAEPCLGYFHDWISDAKKNGFVYGDSVKEALGALGYLSGTLGIEKMQKFVQVLSKLRQCLDDNKRHPPVEMNDTQATVKFGTDIVVPGEYINNEFYVQGYSHYNPILHHVVLFQELWYGFPDASNRERQSDEETWTKYFNEEVFWAPNFPSMINRYQPVFADLDKIDKIPTNYDLRADGKDKNVAIFITNGDVDPLTPPSDADALHNSFKYCKFQFWDRRGVHIRAAAAAHEATLAFITSAATKTNLCETDNDFKKALGRNQTKSDKAAQSPPLDWGKDKDWEWPRNSAAPSATLAVLTLLALLHLVIL